MLKEVRLRVAALARPDVDRQGGVALGKVNAVVRPVTELYAKVAGVERPLDRLLADVLLVDVAAEGLTRAA